MYLYAQLHTKLYIGDDTEAQGRIALKVLQLQGERLAYTTRLTNVAMIKKQQDTWNSAETIIDKLRKLHQGDPTICNLLCKTNCCYRCKKNFWMVVLLDSVQHVLRVLQKALSLIPITTMFFMVVVDVSIVTREMSNLETSSNPRSQNILIQRDLKRLSLQLKLCAVYVPWIPLADFYRKFKVPGSGLMLGMLKLSKRLDMLYGNNNQ